MTISSMMLYAGSAVVITWGLAHVAVPTRSIVEKFEPITQENRRILLMGWLMEGVLLVFLGAIVILVRALAQADELAPTVVYRASAVVLIIMAAISMATGARTSAGLMKLCPPIFVATAMLYWLATVI